MIPSNVGPTPSISPSLCWRRPAFLILCVSTVLSLSKEYCLVLERIASKWIAPWCTLASIYYATMFFMQHVALRFCHSAASGDRRAVNGRATVGLHREQQLSLLNMLSGDDERARNLARTLLSSEARGRELGGNDFESLSGLEDVPRPELKRPRLGERRGNATDLCPVCQESQAGMARVLIFPCGHCFCVTCGERCARENKKCAVCGESVEEEGYDVQADELI
mmetsp:Transcript_16341/g.32526  ORF Transcript_16341/g.32526 Transcript_16341/m.32526 type:complete len:223 (+) Transcript_16341:627-1295(+)